MWRWFLPILRKLGSPVLEPAFAEVCRDMCTNAAHPLLQDAILQKFAAGKDLNIQVSISALSTMKGVPHFI